MRGVSFLDFVLPPSSRTALVSIASHRCRSRISSHFACRCGRSRSLFACHHHLCVAVIPISWCTPRICHKRRPNGMIKVELLGPGDTTLPPPLDFKVFNDDTFHVSLVASTLAAPRTRGRSHRISARSMTAATRVGYWHSSYPTHRSWVTSSSRLQPQPTPPSFSIFQVYYVPVHRAFHGVLTQLRLSPGLGVEGVVGERNSSLSPRRGDAFEIDWVCMHTTAFALLFSFADRPVLLQPVCLQNSHHVKPARAVPYTPGYPIRLFRISIGIHVDRYCRRCAVGWTKFCSIHLRRRDISKKQAPGQTNACIKLLELELPPSLDAIGMFSRRRHSRSSALGFRRSFSHPLSRLRRIGIVSRLLNHFAKPIPRLLCEDSFGSCGPRA